MPTLHWIGKDKVVSHHQDILCRVLEHKYGFIADPSTGAGQEQPEPTHSGNKIIHGDNLEALKSLLPEYEGKIKCIYIDPPYNTGKENWVYNDSVNHPKIKKWLSKVVGKEGEDLSRHDKWLCMMYPRLKLLHKLLADDGAIIISIDDNEYANLKLICDEIFGLKNELSMGVVNKASEIASAFSISKHEYFLIYAKKVERFYIKGTHNEKYTISRGTVGNKNQTTPIITFPKGLKVINLKNGTYLESRKIKNGKENIDNLDPFIVKNGFLKEDVRMKAKWRSSNDMRNFFNNNCRPTKAKINGTVEDIFFDGDRLMPYIKKKTYEKIPSLFLENKRGSLDLERYGLNNKFENPKSPNFITFLIKLLSTKNSTILDSFAGSGTTAHAVLNLNKKDGGNRKFILVEMEDYANDITAERVKRVSKGYGLGTKAVEGTGGAFDYYELGLPILNEIIT